MRTIWKTPIHITDSQVIELPKDSHALNVAFQGSVANVWWLIEDSEEEKVNETLHIYGTGNPIDPVANDNEFYIGTLHDIRRGFVWHVFHSMADD